jgi:hypothetical protein
MIACRFTFWLYLNNRSFPPIIIMYRVCVKNYSDRIRLDIMFMSHRKSAHMRLSTGCGLMAMAIFLQLGSAQAQTNRAFNDAYGAMIGPGTDPRLQDKNYFISQQSNMAGRTSTNAGVNPRGNVDVNPPGFIGDNPFGNSTVPNP